MKVVRKCIGEGFKCLLRSNGDGVLITLVSEVEARSRVEAPIVNIMEPPNVVMFGAESFLVRFSPPFQLPPSLEY